MLDVYLALGFQGIIMGLSNGLSPGPVTTTVMVNTLKGGLKLGTVTALTPVLAGIPIVLSTILLGESGVLNEFALQVIKLLGSFV